MYGSLPFNLEFFTDLQDMNRLLPYLDSRPNEVSDDAGDGSATLPDTPVEMPSKFTESPRSQFLERRRRLHAALCELIEDFGLVSFETLDIQDAESVGNLLAKVDRANGYVFTTSERPAHARASYASTLFQAVSSQESLSLERTLLVQDKYMGFGKTRQFQPVSHNRNRTDAEWKQEVGAQSPAAGDSSGAATAD